MKSRAPRIADPAPTVEIASKALAREIINIIVKPILIINFILKLINMASTSRLIVKNLPKHLKESELREHFKRDNKYAVTDAKIMFAGTKTR
jgi:RNA recognition motif-containing protein